MKKTAQKNKDKNLARERKIIFAIILAAIVTAAVLLSSFSLALAAEANYCCEKTTDGKWCQNAPQSQCDTGFKTAPTSCESTSYCKPGCCFNEVEGNCMESTPQRVCSDSNGIWASNQNCEIPQCNLGCCIMGDQGAFVTLTRCKQLSGFYGLKTDFRTTITDEVTCIATAQSADKGACVTESSSAEKLCRFTTRAGCSSASLSSDINLSTLNITGNKTLAAAGFYKDVLCTAPELGSICGRSTKTAIIEGKDEVYYTDTCGNIANIYDASKYNDNQYWRNTYKKSESCGYGSSNAKSATCGNCDYFQGSIGRKATKATGFAQIGDYICIDLSCKGIGKRHGESWCLTDEPTGNGQDTVGSRYYKEVCSFGEVLTEPCADFRNAICIQDTFNGFSEAACQVNRWQDCMQQVGQTSCENKDVRDCIWRQGYYFSTNSKQIEKSANLTEVAADYCSKDTVTACKDDPEGEDCKFKLSMCSPPSGSLTPRGLCLPNYPPGLAFWGSSSTQTSSGNFTSSTPAFGTGYVNPSSSTAGASASAECSLGNTKVTFNWEKTVFPLKIFGKQSEGWDCASGTSGDACRTFIAESDRGLAEITLAAVKAWAADMNIICGGLGDCGGKANYVGVSTDSGYAAYHGQQRIAGSGGAEILEAGSNLSTGATTPTTTSTNTANNANNIAAGTQALSTATSALNAKAIAPIQGRVIMDYFKSIWAGAR